MKQKNLVILLALTCLSVGHSLEVVDVATEVVTEAMELDNYDEMVEKANQIEEETTVMMPMERGDEDEDVTTINPIETKGGWVHNIEDLSDEEKGPWVHDIDVIYLNISKSN